jgi:hypothetical protein
MPAGEPAKQQARRKRPPLTDPRLLGRWQSDRRKTFHAVTLHRAPPDILRKFKNLFGKLVITWGPTTVTHEMGAYKETGTYRIIARNEHSVVVKVSGMKSFSGDLEHLHFEGDRYSIHAGVIIEWFRKMKE